MDAFKDAIMAYSVYYPLVDFFSAIAIACVIWFGGQDVMSGVVGKERIHRVSPPCAAVLSPRLVAIPASLGVRDRVHRSMRSGFSGPSWTSARSTTSCSLRWRPVNEFSSCWIRQSTLFLRSITKKPEGPGRIEFDHVWFAYRDMPDENDGAQQRWSSFARPDGRGRPSAYEPQSYLTGCCAM